MSSMTVIDMFYCKQLGMVAILTCNYRMYNGINND